MVGTLRIAFVRLLNVVFFAGTSVYCILNYSTFAYEQFLRPQLIGWIPRAVALHPLLFWCVALITIADLWRPLGAKNAAAWGYAIAMIVAAAWLAGHPVLAAVGPDRPSVLQAIAWLLPLFWLAIVDHRASMHHIWGPPSDPRRLFSVCMIAGAAVWVASVVALPWQLRQAVGLELSPAAMLAGASLSLIARLLIFAVGALVLIVALRAATSIGRRAAEHWALVAVQAGALAWVIYATAWSAISFRGPAAWSTAMLLGTAVALVWSGLSWHRAARAGGEMSPVDVWLGPATPARSRAQIVAAAVLLPLSANIAIASVARFDWNFLLQKLIVGLLWALALGWSNAVVPRRARVHRSRPLAVSLAVICLVAVAAAPVAQRAGSRLDPQFVWDRYAAVDPSFGLIRDLARTNSGESVQFYTYLKANSTLGGVPVAPIAIDFTRRFARGIARPPHIFLFVIDSLRRDYLSAYNPAVTFTPNIGRFAAESFAFQRAFTRYGGTGLSVPSIWAGGMLIHKQYVTPFESMNALLKLLNADRYQRMMSLDSVVVQLMAPDQNLVELDAGVEIVKYDFCRTAAELEQKLAAPRASPVFAYSLPQNLHINQIRFKRAPASPSFPGFYPQVAAEVQRIDGCFGRLVEFLQTSGLYDDSVIIITSDHGDSLGEENRWGHSYTLFPEVIRVPLIIHLPAMLRASVATDVERPAFLTDITPTLYELLGEQPADLGPLYGAPLFVPRGREQLARNNEAFLLSSSYGAVYALLRNHARELYIADAITGRDYAYDLTNGNLGTRVTITNGMRVANHQLIRDQIGAVAAQYHFRPNHAPEQ